MARMRFTVSFDEPTGLVLKAYAAAKHTTVAEIARRGIMSEVKRHDRGGPWKRLFAAAADGVWILKRLVEERWPDRGTRTA